VAKGTRAAPEETVAGERASMPFRADERDLAHPSICRFLAIKAGEAEFAPAVGLDTANRCVAIGDPMPQSGRQQELLCLASAHVNCPRYLRGVLLEGTPMPAPAPVRQPVAPAVIGAALVLATALAASFGFLAVRGGFNLPLPTPSPALVAVVASPSAVPSPAAAPTSNPTATPTVPPSSSPEPSASPSPSPSATPAPTPTAPPATPRPTATPAPTSDRFAVLTKCPSTPDCWIYVIRSGDNLESIAHWFGVSYNEIRAMNPNLRIPIQPGDKLRIPTPTR
jgi:hypothetical protein